MRKRLIVVMSPKVSILIPCYNSQAYIAAAIESALTQKYEPKEVIVVDDGSTDESLEVIQQFSGYVSVIKNRDNRGEALTTNRAIKNASGELVKILHADDKLCEGIISEQVQQIMEVDDDTIVFGDAKFVGEGGEFHHRDKYRPKKKAETWAHFLLNNNPPMPSPLHRRALLEANEGLDSSSSKPDVDFHLRLGLNGVRFKYVPQDISMIRIHDGPDRVSNQGHFLQNPKGKLRRIQDRWERIERAGMLSEDVQRFLARSAWRGGRRALREGWPDVAEEYFTYAKQAHADCVAGTSPIYEWCARALGPDPAERLAEWKRDIVGS